MFPPRTWTPTGTTQIPATSRVRHVEELAQIRGYRLSKTLGLFAVPSQIMIRWGMTIILKIGVWVRVWGGVGFGVKGRVWGKGYLGLGGKGVWDFGWSSG